MSVSVLPDGGIRIDGQDLSADVGVFGEGVSEYEWSWVIAPDHVPTMVRLLGGREGDDPIAVLARWNRAHRRQDPGQFLKDAGLEIRFWSRFG